MTVLADAREFGRGTTMSVEGDAQEFGVHVKQGGWRLGLLAARNVERGTAGRPAIGVITPIDGKVSAREFALIAGLSDHKIVLRYFDAWNKAADAGCVTHATELTPGAEVQLDAEHLPDWKTFYDSTLRIATTGQGARVREEAARAGVSIHKVDEAARNPKAVGAAVRAAPSAAQAATEALVSTPEAATRTYEASRRALIEQARNEQPPPPRPEPDARRERVIRIESVTDEVIRGLAEILAPETDHLGQRLNFLLENIDALSDHHRQRLVRALNQLGVRVDAWEDRIRGISGHVVAG